MALTWIPYLLGYALQGDDWRFTGFLFGIEDGNSYIAKMLRGAQGEWLFRTPYTSFSQRGAFFYFPFILLGKLSAPPGQHEQLVALYHLFRTASGFGLVFAVYSFLSLFLQQRFWRRFGTILVTLGGGTGWLTMIGLSGLWNGKLPLDFYSPEVFGFLMMYGLPHLAAARALVLWGLRSYLLSTENPLTWKEKLKTGLIWTGAGMFQPITVIVAWAVIGAHLVIGRLRLKIGGCSFEGANWRAYMKRGLWILLFSAPLVVYTFAAVKIDPVLSSWEVQNRLFSPPLIHYVLAYFFLLPFSAMGVRYLYQKMPWQGLLVIAWAWLFPFLIYLPIGAQRRFVEGAWAAMVILALSWVENRGWKMRRFAAAWFSLSFLTPAIFYMGSLIAVLSPRTPLYRPAQEVKVFQYLAQTAKADEIILASFETSNALPAWAPFRVVTGHGPEGLNSKEMRRIVERFFNSGMNEAERVDFLNEHHVSYVFWGPAERTLGSWDPRLARYIVPVYDNGPYLLFRMTEFSK